MSIEKTSLAEDIIGGIGSATTITYFLSPIFVVYTLIRYGKGGDETPFLIYVFMRFLICFYQVAVCYLYF